MSDSESLAKRWENFRPTKTLWLWSCAGCVAATMIAGFGFAGWVTGGTASEMAESAGEDARAQLAASFCVNNFVQSADASTVFQELKDASSWDRDDIIEEGGWASFEGDVEIVDGSLDLCAEKIVAMESLPVTATQTAEAEDEAEATETVAAADAEATEPAEDIVTDEAEEPEEGAAAEQETEEPVEEAATEPETTDS